MERQPAETALKLQNSSTKPQKHVWGKKQQLLWYTLAVLAATADAVSTWTMMGSGLFEEANPYANTLMSAAGTELWIVGASALFLLLSSPVLLTPNTLLKKALVSYAVVIIALKIVAGVNNITLYMSVNG